MEMGATHNAKQTRSASDDSDCFGEVETDRRDQVLFFMKERN